MSEVKRPFEIFRAALPDGEFCRRADVVELEHFDAQRLRADTAEAELRVTKQAIASLKNERDADDRKFKCLGEILYLLKDHPIVKAHQLHIDAALNHKPEAARCMNCDLATVEQCDDAGCGFLGAGNGEPVKP